MNRTAVLSSCGSYRYILRREWDMSARALLVCMLNPSTADAEHDDATIRWLCGYARRWGHGGVHVVNLCAWRATDPRELSTATDPVGPLNEQWLRQVLAGRTVLTAWGNGARCTPAADRMARVVRSIAAAKLTLGITAQGEPRHPLRVAHSTEMVAW